MLSVTPATGSVGADVDGVDLRSVAGPDRDALLAAWHRHGVLFFRDQHLAPDEQEAAAQLFGDPDEFEMAPNVDGRRFAHLIATDGPRRHGGATTWHSDATWKERPPRASILQAVELPPVGGDTLFATAHGAFESLSSGLQRMVLELTATHAGGEALERAGRRVDEEVPPAVHHPVVRRHPEADTPCLFVNGVFTQHLDGIPRRESRVLLPLLCDQFTDPELQCRFTWQPGDVAVWDNRAVQHYATPDYEGPRTMHRVVLAGDPVVPFRP